MFDLSLRELLCIESHCVTPRSSPRTAGESNFKSNFTSPKTTSSVQASLIRVGNPTRTRLTKKGRYIASASGHADGQVPDFRVRQRLAVPPLFSLYPSARSERPKTCPFAVYLLQRGSCVGMLEYLGPVGLQCMALQHPSEHAGLQLVLPVLL